MRPSEKAQFETVRPLTEEAFEARCREGGMRLPPTQRAIVVAITRMDGPFDFPRLFAAARRWAPTIARNTIYRSMRRMAALGLIRKVEKTPLAAAGGPHQALPR